MGKARARLLEHHRRHRLKARPARFAPRALWLGGEDEGEGPDGPNSGVRANGPYLQSLGGSLWTDNEQSALEEIIHEPHAVVKNLPLARLELRDENGSHLGWRLAGDEQVPHAPAHCVEREVFPSFEVDHDEILIEAPTAHVLGGFDSSIQGALFRAFAHPASFSNNPISARATVSASTSWERRASITRLCAINRSIKASSRAQIA